MSSTYISEKVRERVRNEALHRFGYCLSAQEYVYITFHIEHIIPSALGGGDDESNLWLACGRCNVYKGAQTTGLDQITNQIVPLFNPRTQGWKEHFSWDASGIQIIGLTAIGRATVVALQLNSAQALIVRRNWVKVGWHPPEDSI